ncbi:uncharacterized protein MYCGRDRAFT_94360 [Zymoseptoria tritici IPO323]|uniref:Secreted protein n=1 Tax=Zymoseptoria tritici (strain CBS 115943 / IPO323) TaxID=336722 RepID=F9XFA7_ZYMTI|nr:uncharacterized protein MYCGRDRAFT_94360 [Zymoseptoria tritici IPO323]EGP86195.1 hypothetical protein MYCGRDRAFT_94360 [Zymoseptoria tritici IPO323]
MHLLLFHLLSPLSLLIPSISACNSYCVCLGANGSTFDCSVTVRGWYQHDSHGFVEFLYHSESSITTIVRKTWSVRVGGRVRHTQLREAKRKVQAGLRTRVEGLRRKMAMLGVGGRRRASKESFRNTDARGSLCVQPVFNAADRALIVGELGP